LQVVGAGAVPVLLHIVSARHTDEETALAALDVLNKIALNGNRSFLVIFVRLCSDMALA
jgi:hypothetical protein